MKDVIIIGNEKLSAFLSNFLANFNLKTDTIDLFNSEYNLKSHIENNFHFINFPEEIYNKIKDYSLVIFGLYGKNAYKILMNILKLKVNVIIFSSYYKNSINLMKINNIAKINGVSAVVIPGIFSGLSNYLVGVSKGIMGKFSELRVYEGNLTKNYEGGFGVVPGWDIFELLDVYIRPAKFIENKKLIKLDPLESRVGRIYIESIGELEYFPIDLFGNTILEFNDIKCFETYALRWPDHIEFMKSIKKKNYSVYSPTKYNNKIYKRIILSLAEKYINMDDIHIVVTEAIRDRKGVRLTQINKASSNYKSFEIITGVFLSSIIEILNENLIQKGLIFPMDLGMKEETSLKIMEKFISYKVIINEEYFFKKS